MENHIVITFDSSHAQLINERPREFAKRTYDAITGLMYKMGVDEIKIYDKTIAKIQNPKMNIEESLFIFKDGSLNEFNPMLRSYFELKEKNPTKFKELSDVLERLWGKIKGEEKELLTSYDTALDKKLISVDDEDSKGLIDSDAQLLDLLNKRGINISSIEELDNLFSKSDVKEMPEPTNDFHEWLDFEPVDYGQSVFDEWTDELEVEEKKREEQLKVVDSGLMDIDDVLDGIDENTDSKLTDEKVEKPKKVSKKKTPAKKKPVAKKTSTKKVGRPKKTK